MANSEARLPVTPFTRLKINITSEDELSSCEEFDHHHHFRLGKCNQIGEKCQDRFECDPDYSFCNKKGICECTVHNRTVGRVVECSDCGQTQHSIQTLVFIGVQTSTDEIERRLRQAPNQPLTLAQLGQMVPATISFIGPSPYHVNKNSVPISIPDIYNLLPIPIPEIHKWWYFSGCRCDRKKSKGRNMQQLFYYSNRTYGENCSLYDQVIDNGICINGTVDCIPPYKNSTTNHCDGDLWREWERGVIYAAYPVNIGEICESDGNCKTNINKDAVCKYQCSDSLLECKKVCKCSTHEYIIPYIRNNTKYCPAIGVHARNGTYNAQRLANVVTQKLQNAKIRANKASHHALYIAVVLPMLDY
ncbi:hypothetical protein GQR58_024453 [Nymphon striatum]|nr:hypothetical protein GQR58_024453 [Nymphon striatum]